MATIDSRHIIDEIIRNNGFYENDPQVYMIVEYTNAYGNTTWGVTWISESKEARERYLMQSDFVRAPKVIWRATIQ
jgi:hypothetical protein